jgi:hypothetical protein
MLVSGAKKTPKTTEPRGYLSLDPGELEKVTLSEL